MFIPYEAAVPMQRYPWTNFVLIGITAIVSLIALADEGILRDLAATQQSGPTTFITYGFVHAGIMHLIGNMLFLYVFGNAVNTKIGHAQYLVLYLVMLAASVGVQLRFLSTPVSIVGASGAIYGVMGMFIVLYPRNEISCCWFVFYRMSSHFGSFEVSSIWIVLYWVLCDVAMLKLDLAGNVGVHAHLAGFAFGAAAAIAATLVRLIGSDECEENLLESVGLMGQWQEVD